MVYNGKKEVMGMSTNNRMPSEVHPIIRKCLTHLDILGADDKLKQIVYMYMESLHPDVDSTEQCPKEQAE